jgi:DNA-binding MarR family transcriptional regulator
LPRPNHKTSLADYRALAEFRFLIRRFLNNGENAARSAGLEPQQYQGLLTMCGMPADKDVTISSLAERLQIRHHSAVELIDRMEKRGLCRRERSKTDRRNVLVHVTPRGEKLLNRLVQHRIAELQVTGPALAEALAALLTPASRQRRPQGCAALSKKGGLKGKPASGRTGAGL